MTTATTHDEQFLRTLARGCWASLPALALGAAAVCLAALVPLVAVPGVNALSVALAGVVFAPVLAGLIGVVDAVATDGELTIGQAWRAGRRRAATGLRAAAAPTVFTELFLAAWLLWTQHGSGLLVPSLALTGAAACLSVVLWAVVVARDDGVDAAAWLRAGVLVAAHPVPFLAAAVSGAAAVWCAFVVGIVLVPLLPVPCFVVLVAAVRTAN